MESYVQILLIVFGLALVAVFLLLCCYLDRKHRRSLSTAAKTAAPSLVSITVDGDIEKGKVAPCPRVPNVVHNNVEKGATSIAAPTWTVGNKDIKKGRYSSTSRGSRNDASTAILEAAMAMNISTYVGEGGGHHHSGHHHHGGGCYDGGHVDHSYGGSHGGGGYDGGHVDHSYGGSHGGSYDHGSHSYGGFDHGTAFHHGGF